MLQFSKRKLITYILLIALCSVNMVGCNNKDEAADGQVSDEAADEALQNAVADVLSDDGQNQPQNTDNPQTAPDAGDGAPVQKAIAERSPVEINRIEVPEPYADGAGEVGDEKDPHDHEPAPNLFEIDECQVEVWGTYQVKLAKDLLKEINSRRKDYGIGQLKQNTSLLACADSRCKEQTYFIGHFRPDGSAFTSVAPDYVQGECIAVDHRTVKDIMEAWFSVNKSRMQIMNPDYTQCGISIYDIEGTYYCAAVFSY